MFFNFVNVLLILEYGGGVAFVTGRNLSWDLFIIKDFKAARCLGVRLSGVLSCLGF